MGKIDSLITIFAIKGKIMEIEYRFTSDEEPTDEQLHLLMQDVAIDVKKRVLTAERQFAEQLQKLLLNIYDEKVSINPDTK